MAWKEVVTYSEFTGLPLSSDLVECPDIELAQAKAVHLVTGECSHEFIIDKNGFAYDIRICAVCDKLLGLV